MGKIKFKLFSIFAIRAFAKKKGFKSANFSRLHDILIKTNRIDVIPLSAGRGFMIVLDGQTSFWFYQNGDHFKYDGFEIGQYEKGDVTIFDTPTKP